MQTMPTWQRIVLFILLIGSLFMAASLLYMRGRAARKLANAADAYPIVADSHMPAAPVTLEIANDNDGSLTPVQITMALPADTNARVRAMLDRLLSEYAQPQSTHPLSGAASAGSAIDEVFLLDMHDDHGRPTGSLMAVVNLHSHFADAHPSGIAVESLTLLSIVTTLHDNFPGIAQVRFLVDGATRPTLAGHADLTRAYLTAALPVTSPAAQ
jgi:hypothetical protein